MKLKYKQRGFLLNPYRFGGSSDFIFNDIGGTGWTYPSLRPTTVVGADRTARLSNTESGSRIYYIDPVDGLPYSSFANQAAALNNVYFWNGTNIIDADGNTTGDGGIAYGTDPHNPTGPVKAFKSWSMVSPKSGGAEVVRNTTGSYCQLNVGTSQWRSGKPDWWLFKRGTALSIYSDVRQYLDDTGRSGTAMTGSGVVSTANGGTSNTSPAVLGCYGDPAVGRAVLKHPIYGIFAWFGSSIYPNKHVRYFGIECDGSDRDRPVRPIDWTYFTGSADTNVATHVTFLNMGADCWDHNFEDMYFNCPGVDITFNAIKTHTTENSTYDWRLFRSIIADTYKEDATNVCTVSKASGDPDQSIPANTQAIVTWPTETLDSSNYFTSNTYTLGTGLFSWKFWPLLDIVADINVGGSIRVSLFKNGVEVDFYELAGTGVAGATYSGYRVLSPGKAIQANGSAYDIRVSSTGATSAVLIKGGGVCRLTVNRMNLSTGVVKVSGLFSSLYKGSTYYMAENIFVRNGFRVDPRNQSSTLPDGSATFYDWDIFNHNWYTVGDCSLTNVIQEKNVCMLGAAGAVVRNPGKVNKNFFYEGYVSVSLEQRTTYSSKSGEFNDNVLQRFLATSGSVSAHPGWGIQIATGAYQHEVLRNIVSDVQVGSNGQWAVKISCIASPYQAQNCFIWRNDVTNLVIQNNIFDSGSSNADTEPIIEANGSNRLASMWKTSLSGTIADGQVITATVAGTAGIDYTGTPQYEWFRFSAGSDTNVSVKGPSADNTYTLVAANNDFVDNSDAVPTSLVICKVTGITYVAGNGIKGTQATNNVVVKPGAKALTNYYSSDSSGGVSGADIFTIPPVPATSDIVTTGTVSYVTRAAAASALSWPNSEASLKTHLQGLGIPVSTSDGFLEYYDTVIASEPMRYGHWDDRFLGHSIGNTIRIGRNMATV